MVNSQPLFFPEPLVAEYAMVLANDFAFEHVRCCHGKDGQLYVLSKLDYNYFRYDRNDRRPSFTTYVLNVYDTEFRSIVVTDFTQLYRELAGPDDWDHFDPWLSVTAENLVVLSTKANRTFLFDPLLEGRLGAFATSGQAQEMYDGNFAFQAEPTPDKRLLCVVSEPGVKTIHFSPNLVCVSDGSLGVERRPQLNCIGCVYSTLDYERNARFPYIRMSSGERVGTGFRPVPSLLSQASELFGVRLYDGWIKQALPLDETKCVVSLFHKYMRGGSKGLPFVFGILDYTGRIVGRLEGIDDYNESPYTDHHHMLAVDQRHRRIVYKNKAAFFLFDFDGRLLAKVPLDNADVKAMAAFHLGCCGPDGQIVLYQPKQHLVLQMDPIAQPADLESAIAMSMIEYNAQRSKLKKQHAPESYRWLVTAPAIRH